MLFKKLIKDITLRANLINSPSKRRKTNLSKFKRQTQGQPNSFSLNKKKRKTRIGQKTEEKNITSDTSAPKNNF